MLFFLVRVYFHILVRYSFLFKRNPGTLVSTYQLIAEDMKWYTVPARMDKTSNSFVYMRSLDHCFITAFSPIHCRTLTPEDLDALPLSSQPPLSHVDEYVGLGSTSLAFNERTARIPQGERTRSSLHIAANRLINPLQTILWPHCAILYSTSYTK